ncbi:unnamed protein product, partial [Iphiclides podalirius]
MPVLLLSPMSVRLRANLELNAKTSNSKQPPAHKTLNGRVETIPGHENREEHKTHLLARRGDRDWPTRRTISLATNTSRGSRFFGPSNGVRGSSENRASIGSSRSTRHNLSNRFAIAWACRNVRVIGWDL